MSRAALIVSLSFVAACGGSTGPAAPAPPDNPNRITITAAGVANPTELTVAPGARVLFVNNHAQRHHMSSDPHPEHTDCPEINQVGVLQPGQSRETGNLNTVRTCGFHDHDQSDNRNLQGPIVIQ